MLSQNLELLTIKVIIQKIKFQGLETFGNNCHKVIEYARHLSKCSQRIDSVFDSYYFHSRKDCERKRRSMQAPIELSNALENTPLPVDMNMFWGSSKTETGSPAA